MNSIRAAIYARVSSEQQAAAHTIQSQLAALTERAHADGLPVPQERQFLDDGQVLLIDEGRRAGIEIVFSNRSLGKSPEDDLLLQVTAR